ncbi:hypothetical protein CEXT_255101 [Caerostris extrusa]|uniref:Uncharacterized protein n=1 Tax=Caerostris extrusa TaxID=172846 RepID=A0AAV4Y0P9_CAEEX|nr:hypothetical protein CEXT_255101 [Caerostris extrusa]
MPDRVISKGGVCLFIITKHHVQQTIPADLLHPLHLFPAHQPFRVPAFPQSLIGGHKGASLSDLLTVSIIGLALGVSRTNSASTRHHHPLLNSPRPAPTTRGPCSCLGKRPLHPSIPSCSPPR